MISRLEDTLLRLRGEEEEDRFRETLFGYLDDGISLLRLRSVSRALCNIVGHLPIEMVFRQMYIHTPLPVLEKNPFFESIAEHCTSLTITIGDAEAVRVRKPSRPGSQISRRSQEFVQSLWDRLNQVGRGDVPTRRDSRNTVASLRQSLTSMVSGTNSPRLPTSPFQHAFEEQAVQDKVQVHWFDVLSRFQNLSSFTLRVHGDTDWPGRTEIEQTLIHIRIAIEQVNLPNLQTFNLIPVHAMGLIHLTWSGVNAFGESFASSAEIWQRLHTLDLRIHYPSKLSDSQRIMFMKSLYKYLDSFSGSLVCLRLLWLGAEGPSPPAMHLEPGLIEQSRPPIIWHELEELWLGNITRPYRTIRLIPHFAPHVKVIKNLRSTHRDSLTVDSSDSSAWLKVELTQTMLNSPIVDSASSLYSRESARWSEPWPAGISRSSRDIDDLDVALDVTGELQSRGMQ